MSGSLSLLCQNCEAKHDDLRAAVYYDFTTIAKQVKFFSTCYISFSCFKCSFYSILAGLKLVR